MNGREGAPKRILKALGPPNHRTPNAHRDGVSLAQAAPASRLQVLSPALTG